MGNVCSSENPDQLKQNEFSTVQAEQPLGLDNVIERPDPKIFELYDDLFSFTNFFKKPFNYDIQSFFEINLDYEQSDLDQMEQNLSQSLVDLYITTDQLMQLKPENREQILYIGDWKDSIPNGIGKIFYKDSQKCYQGLINKGRTFQNGLIVYPNGTYYIGSVNSNCEAQGNGTSLTLENDKYIGNFKNDRPQGKGQLILHSGCHYTGMFENGIKKGKGKQMWLEKNNEVTEKYEGEFSQNLYNGKGIYKWKDGRQYDGDWKDGLMEGFGIFTWKDNRIYIGEYSEDQKTGFGQFIWPDGRNWVGYWLQGKQNGKGLLLKQDLDLSYSFKYGLWEDGQFIKWIDEQEQKSNVKEDKLTYVKGDNIQQYVHILEAAFEEFF